MKSAAALFVLLGLAGSFQVSGQSGAPAQPPPPDSASAPPVQPPPAAYERPVSWTMLPRNLVSDQKRVWTFPAKLGRKRVWIPAAVVLGATAALVAADPHVASYFRNTTSFGGFNRVFNSQATMLGTIVAPSSLYAAGLIRRDSKMKGTALLAGEAVADAEILTTVLKDSIRRVRPAGVPADGNFSDTWFESGGSFFRGAGSFPSGHTIAAFSVATVIARRYGNHRWVPFVAYGAAALVGFSRIPLGAHFTSDVLMGAALGYSISRFAVLRQ